MCMICEPGRQRQNSWGSLGGQYSLIGELPANDTVSNKVNKNPKVENPLACSCSHTHTTSRKGPMEIYFQLLSPFIVYMRPPTLILHIASYTLSIPDLRYVPSQNRILLYFSLQIYINFVLYHVCKLHIKIKSGLLQMCMFQYLILMI